MDKDQALRMLSETFDDLVIAADVAITRGDLAQEGWGVREILAHVAAWEDEGTRRIPLLAEGALSINYDENAFNAAAVDAVAEQSLSQVRAGLERTHARLINTLNEMDSSTIEAEPVASWINSLAAHSRDHAHELQGAATLQPEII